MLLAIDAGNTNVVFALMSEDGVRHRWRISTVGNRTADEYMVWLIQLMQLENLKPEGITGAIIATVVPQTLFPLQLLCRRYFQCEPLVIGAAEVDLGIAVKAQDVGADRLVNAVAAHDIYGGALVILDFGTATTFDVVDEEGAYIGGVISPGINLSLEALHMAAAKLPRIAVERPERVIGRATVPAMQSGVYWGYVGLIEGIVSRIKAEYGAPMKVIATGGLATLFYSATDVIEAVDQELTIKGLRMIYQLNQLKK
ncbi:type III pantothenate kinase [Govanella unica]|uniref:Type III pantothenate kinase n=1 Tax=Govanella unica TaxID=2975056 RepID=A0A9X3TXZ3_9PROT|nr:type III pantothenate kinase [Govania unica]MDA5193754.1 type III pantothenate kinase [Govania unica]